MNAGQNRSSLVSKVRVCIILLVLILNGCGLLGSGFLAGMTAKCHATNTEVLMLNSPVDLRDDLVRGDTVANTYLIMAVLAQLSVQLIVSIVLVAVSFTVLKRLQV